MDNSLACPNCNSTELKVGCCGDTTAVCRSCGLTFDGGISNPCPIVRPLEPTAEVPLPFEDMRFMDDGESMENKLWGI